MPAAPAPIAPVIQEGPVLVIVVPARTAKLPAVNSPGLVAASAVAGQIRMKTAARPSETRDRRKLITSVSLLLGITKSARVCHKGPAASS